MGQCIAAQRVAGEAGCSLLLVLAILLVHEHREALDNVVPALAQGAQRADGLSQVGNLQASAQNMATK
jgi:hypothetical protein